LASLDRRQTQGISSLLSCMVLMYTVYIVSAFTLQVFLCHPQF